MAKYVCAYRFAFVDTFSMFWANQATDTIDEGKSFKFITSLFVTVFWKTDFMIKNAEIYFLPVHARMLHSGGVDNTPEA